MRDDGRMHRALRFVFALLAVLPAACGGGGGSGATGPSGGSTPGPAEPYQPLAVGDHWSYACHFRNPPKPGTFPVANAVNAVQPVGGVKTFAFAVQVVTSPSQISTVTMLLDNDAHGNTVLRGYLANGSVLPVTPTIIVAADPIKGASYDYPAEDGATVTRVFEAFTVTNPTPLGTFPVAVYYESGGTHNYGYTQGKGITEEDHGPNFAYDCLISAIHLR
jgi:hypothetical protein